LRIKIDFYENNPSKGGESHDYAIIIEMRRTTMLTGKDKLVRFTAAMLPDCQITTGLRRFLTLDYFSCYPGLPFEAYRQDGKSL